MKKEFVSHEIALALKKLGFDEECLACFSPSTELILGKDITDTYGHEYVMAPLWQQVIDWFREKYNIAIFIDMNCMEDKGYTFYIGDLISRETIFENYESINTYPEAREQAILKALELCQQKTIR